MGITTILGFIVAIVGILGGMFFKGIALGALFNIPGIFIVIIGTLGATMISFPMSVIASMPSCYLTAMKGPAGPAGHHLAESLVTMADKARREGLLALEEEAQKTDDPFTRKGLMLMIDGTDPEALRSIMEIEIEGNAHRNAEKVEMFKTGAAYAPSSSPIEGRRTRESESTPALPATPLPMPMPSAASEEPWSRQLDQMRTMLEQLVSERLDQRLDSGPSLLRDMKERLVRYGVTPALAAGLLNDVDGLSARDEHALTSSVEQRLAGKLPPPVRMNVRRQRAIFLVGPGGAGKTTMAIRMALDLQRQGVNAVIAGTDVNRAGAPQQLTAFGAVTGLDVRLCYGPGELQEILQEPGVDVVIVDTPGHNGLRRDRMAELSSFLQSARQRQVLLTVPATMKGSDLMEVVSAFSAVGLDGAVLTRCDETLHFGHLAAVLIEAAIGLAYTTHSDQVSDAPAPADNLALTEAIVRAQWPATSTNTDARRPAAGRTLAKVG